MHATDIQDVIAKLTALVEDARDQGDRNGLFALLYLHVTENIAASIEAGAFDDGPRMDRFDTAFANRYLAELDAWRKKGGNSAGWREAFTLAARRDGAMIQHMLLGVNAHINYDLAIAAADVSPGKLIHALERDFFTINEILWAALKRIQDALGRISPCMHLLDVVGANADELILDFSIRKARQEAWEHAVILAFQPGREREGTLSRLESRTGLLARLIARPGGLLRPALELIEATEEQDTGRAITRLMEALPRPRRG